MKKPVKMAVIALTALLALGFVKDAIVHTVLAGSLSKIAHVPVKISSVQVSFLRGSIRLRGLRVYNPRGFGDKLMLDVPQVYIALDTGALFQKRLHFREVKINLKELTVVKNKEGRLNIHALKPGEDEHEREKKQPKKAPKAPKMAMDKLSLSVGQVVYKDYTGPGAPAIQTFHLNMVEREYYNIQNPKALVSLIMFEALTNTTLSRIANLDLGFFKQIGTQAFSDGLGFMGDGKDALEKAAKKLVNLL